MSTHAKIFVELEDGSITGTYCHYDGYVDGVGLALRDASVKEVTEQVLKAQKTGGFRSFHKNEVTYLDHSDPCVYSSLTDTDDCNVQYVYVKRLDNSVDAVIDGYKAKLFCGSCGSLLP